MSSDERLIRALVQRWQAATIDGDTDTVLSLMSDDALFLTCGNAPMTQADFALRSAAMHSEKPRIAIDQQIQELEISGALAFMRSTLSVSITPPGGPAEIRRAGQTLTIFKKTGDRWLLFRDANLLAPLGQA